MFDDIYTSPYKRQIELRNTIYVSLFTDLVAISFIIYMLIVGNLAVIVVMILMLNLIIFSSIQLYWYIKLKKKKYLPTLKYDENIKGYRHDYVYGVIESVLLINYLDSISIQSEDKYGNVILKIESVLKNTLTTRYNFDLHLTQEGLKDLIYQLKVHHVDIQSIVIDNR